MSAPHVHELRVRYGECDPQGIVFNANYVAYFDVAYTELWREAVGPWQEMVERHGVDAVVAELTVTFRAPARFDDVLALRSTVVHLGTSSIRTEVDVTRDGELLVRGLLRHVIVGAETWRPAPIPDAVRAGLRRFTAPQASQGEAA